MTKWRSTCWSAGIAILITASLTLLAQRPQPAKVELGSTTAKNGFKNEDEIRDKFNAWKTDDEARQWLQIMGYRADEITNVTAAKPHDEKSDVDVVVTTPAGTTKHGISIKLVSTANGFNQIDKRWISHYAKLWSMPPDVETALKLFVGETAPRQGSREANRMFLDELTIAERTSILRFFESNRERILHDLFSGDGPHAAGWFVVAQKTDRTRWLLRRDTDAIHFFGDGKIELTANGNLKIGRITMQRKGGDGGRETAKMLQFKINPALLFNSPEPEQWSGNPILPGWYADPEARIFQNEYWIFPTYSAPYNEQTFLDAFSSKDLITWRKHERVLDIKDVPWAKRAVWAPSIVHKGDWYYLFFGANDIQNDQQIGGIGVARSRRPEGPFIDHLGKPLIDKFHNGAQPIDQFVYEDRDGSYYIIYGGWRHCNIARLNKDFTGLEPFPDGTTFREITPAGYVEGAFMFVRDGKYYFMWSEGGWTGPDYAVAYAVATSPFGPFTRVGKILQQDPTVATGAGHHSILHAPNSYKWYIVYHRRPLGETDRNHRVVCIDELHFDDKGMILPVTITKTGVPRDVIR